MKLYKDICCEWISHTSAEIFFTTDDVDKCLRNTIDLLLFYGEHFYGFLESDFSKVKIYKMAEATLILGNRFF